MITHDHKLIFIHVPKTGGRSICNLFNQRFDHFTALYYCREYPEFFQEYKTFAIVRHPLDRMVSAYHYIKQHRRHPFEPIGHLGDSRVNHSMPMPSFQEWLSKNILNFRGSFHRESPEGGRGQDYELGSGHWFSSQLRRVSGMTDEIIVDAIFKFEDGFGLLEKWLGVGLTIPHVNKSSHGPWHEYYPQSLLDQCRNFKPFAEDCSAFGYDF